MVNTSSTETFSLEEKQHSNGISWTRFRIVLVVFVLLLLIVGLLTGFLAAKSAREEVEEKYAKLGGNGDAAKTTLNPRSTTVVPSGKPACSGKQWCNVRLPEHIRPYHYNLEILSDVKNLKYDGQVEILLSVSKPIDVILVHIKEKLITKVNLQSIDGKSEVAQMESHFAYPENEYYVTKFEEDLSVGNYSFTLNFKSNISSTLTGYYKSQYKENGQNKTLLTTKFQPTDARRAFPCLDEPDLKATFSITMKHPSEYHARSNEPGQVIETSNGITTTRFNKTVKMSPYLICFIVSQFQSKYEGITGNNNMTITIWSQPKLVSSTEYAYNVSIKMMAFMEDFLGVDYPMPKLDMFAIPDYGSGATEHWGIITYRESRLLYTPGVSSEGNKRSSAGIIAHECAHLWFGNLVTCKWWNDLWVQEGLASYMENYAIHHVHPEWNVKNNFLVGDWSTGMTLDSYASSHPISQDVTHPRQIKEIFDSITYNKGAALFQMLDYYLGVDLFKAGLKEYLTTNQYKGATVGDLWKAFDQITGRNITSIMETWTRQMGFPVITITKTTDGFDLTQKHFLVDPQANVTRKSPFNYQWKIPFMYALSNNLTGRLTKIISDEKESISSKAQWIVGNFNHRGFYRVNYDENGWKKIQQQLNENYSIFEPIDRAGFIDDAFTLARAGQTSYAIALDMLTFTEKDTDSLVWSTTLDNLAFLDNILSSTDAYTMLRMFIANKMKRFPNLMSNAGYLSTAAKAGDEKAILAIQEMFKQWMENGTKIPTNLRSTVLTYGVAYGGDKEWQYVYDQFRNETNPSTRSKLQSALSATRQPWILNRWLRYSIDPDIVKTQDTVYVIGRIASSNPIGKYLAWNFANENWNKIMEIAKENNFHVAYITSRLTSQFTTQYDLEMAEEMWRRYPDAGTGANARVQGIEKIKGNIYWLSQNYGTLEAWLKKNTMQ